MPGPPPVARRRAECELLADPYRSDYVIAQLARCARQPVARWRRKLARSRRSRLPTGWPVAGTNGLIADIRRQASKSPGSVRPVEAGR